MFYYTRMNMQSSSQSPLSNRGEGMDLDDTYSHHHHEEHILGIYGVINCI